MAINVAQHIKELLYDDHMIIIPELGMISAEYVPAVTNHRENTIAPPHYKYVFEERIKESDGVLIDVLVENHNISMSQAELLLKSYSTQIVKSIKEGKTIVLAGIGRLYSNNVGKIILEKNESTIDPYSHHLPVIQLKGLPTSSRGVRKVDNPVVIESPVSQKKVESKPVISSIKKGKVIEKKPSTLAGSSQLLTSEGGGKAIVSTIVPSATVVTKVSEKREKEKKKSFSALLLGLALVSFLLVLFSGIYFLSDNESNFWNKFKSKSSSSTLVKEEKTFDEKDVSINDTATSGVNRNKNNSTTDPSNTITSSQLSLPSKESSCVIIVGMFSQQENVKKLIAKIERKGFKAYTEQMSRGTQLGIFTECNNTKTILDYAQNNIEQGSFLKRL